MARQAELTGHLEAALASRSTIDHAIGMITGQNRCGTDEAFALLRLAERLGLFRGVGVPGAYSRDGLLAAGGADVDHAVA